MNPQSPKNEIHADSAEMLKAGLLPFEPRRGLTNGHLQTIVGNYLPRPAFLCNSVAETVEVDPNDGSRVLCFCDWQPEPDRANLTLILVHGLEGSSESRYIKGIAARAWAAGCNVVRMNMRNCGGTDELTPTLYHSGLSSDVGRVVRHYAGQFGLERVALVGYSMGGNLVLKLAGEWGSAAAPLCAIAAVCPAIDLSAGSDALHEPANRIYEWHFLWRLMQRYRRKVALYPQIYGNAKIGPIRSLREFDNNIVARYCGFRDADDYYYRAASARVVDRIAVPTLIIRAKDDPFVRFTLETRSKLIANPNILLVETQHGGHCAYLSRDRGDDIHWAEANVVRYLLKYSSVAKDAISNGS